MVVHPDLAHWELYEGGASSSFGSAVPGWPLGGIAGHFFGTNVRRVSLVHGVKSSQFSATTIAGSVFSKSFMLSDPDLIPFDPPAHPLVGWPGRRTFLCNRDYIIATQELPVPAVALCRSRGAVAQQIP